MKKWSTPKAVKSKKFLEKGLELLGESMGLGKPFFAALTFDDTKESPVIYGKDLQIPAFIRRQND